LVDSRRRDKGWIWKKDEDMGDSTCEIEKEEPWFEEIETKKLINVEGSDKEVIGWEFEVM